MQNSKRSLMLLPFAWRQWTGYCCSSFLFGVCSVFCSWCPVSVQSLSSAGENSAMAIAMQKKIVLLFSSLGFPRLAQCSCPALPCLAVWLHPNSAPGSVKCKCLHRKLACIELISSSCVKWKELRGLSPSLPLDAGQSRRRLTGFWFIENERFVGVRLLCNNIF